MSVRVSRMLKCYMPRKLSMESIEDWMQENYGLVWDVAEKHYAKLGRGTVLIHVNSKKGKIQCTYLPLDAVDKAFEKSKADDVRANIAKYDPETQFVVAMFGDERALGCSICINLPHSN